ncbi:hypothetical protein JXA34_04285 [Patescibacteria group bacterium]|nr:hypothetical protein [Patescibacteria group bacterium]
MGEIIITRKIQNPEIITPVDRAAFYEKEIQRAKEGKEPEISVDVVNILLFNEHREMFVQKRSKDKYHNPNLLDKSLGGHIEYGDMEKFLFRI